MQRLRKAGNTVLATNVMGRDDAAADQSNEPLPLIEITFHLFDYDRVGRNDPLGIASLSLERKNLGAHYSFAVRPIMIKAGGLETRRGYVLTHLPDLSVHSRSPTGLI